VSRDRYFSSLTDQAHRLLAAGFSGASIIGPFIILLGFGRFTRGERAESETAETNTNMGA